MADLYYAVRCWLRKPVCYRKPYIGFDDGYFAMCRHCHRQAEVHVR